MEKNILYLKPLDLLNGRIKMIIPIVMIMTRTFTKDIQPIFERNCAQCHDSMGEKNWQVYENVYKYKDKIKEKVITKKMPMGRSMPDEDREAIVQWIDQGAKKE